VKYSPGGSDFFIAQGRLGTDVHLQYHDTALRFPAWSPAAGSWPMTTNAWFGEISTSNGVPFYRVIGQE